MSSRKGLPPLLARGINSVTFGWQERQHGHTCMALAVFTCTLVALTSETKARESKIIDSLA
eukprot:699682-Amphidinium_carterae.1